MLLVRKSSVPKLETTIENVESHYVINARALGYLSPSKIKMQNQAQTATNLANQAGAAQILSHWPQRLYGESASLSASQSSSKWPISAQASAAAESYWGGICLVIENPTAELNNATHRFHHRGCQNNQRNAHRMSVTVAKQTRFSALPHTRADAELITERQPGR